jgi:DNA topoisomerase-1
LLASAALLEAHTAGSRLTTAETLRAVAAVAAQLGNTPTVCRKCYIHPAILKSFEDEHMLGSFVKAFTGRKRESGLAGNEGALLRFLRSAPSLGSVARHSRLNACAVSLSPPPPRPGLE